jgi:hypothetical protein
VKTNPVKTNPVKTKWKLERWQAVLAAVIAAVASVGVAVITTFGTSSTPVTATSPPTESDSPALASSSPASGDFSQRKSSQVSAVITLFSMNPYSPPPGESYAFYGTVTNLPSGKNLLDLSGSVSVYVLECEPPGKDPDTNGSDCLTSPPANLSENDMWNIDGWRIKDPFKDARWSVMVTQAFAGGLLEVFPLPRASVPPELQKFVTIYEKEHTYTIPGTNEGGFLEVVAISKPEESGEFRGG